MKKEIEPFSMF